MKNRKIISLTGALIALAFVVTACNKAGSTPTATAKAFYDAVKSKDVQGMKNTMSKDSIKELDDMAKASGKTVDDILKQGPGGDFPDAFESKDEKITGDTATIKMKGKGEKWDTLPFIKEDGQWKIAFDKMGHD